MARKLLPGEELVFSQPQPITELVFDDEEDDLRSSRRKVNRGWPKSRLFKDPSEDVQQEASGANDDGF